MSDYKKQTDKVHEITLDSSITAAEWGSKVAAVGSQVRFEVWTHFVGSGSEIEIKVEDKNGKKVETIKGHVYGDYFAGALVIPEKAKEELTFTAKLSDHGLEKKSGILNVIPPFRITNLKWNQKEARRGDLVKMTADTEGLEDGTEVMLSIFEHDQDGAHDFVTRFPAKLKGKKLDVEWEFEYHQDTDDIPTTEEMKPMGQQYADPEYFFVVRYGRTEARSGLLRFRDWIEISLRGDDGRPIPDEEFVLYLPDGREKRGTLDTEGSAKVDDVPAGPYRVEFPDIEDVELRDADDPDVR